MEIKLDTDEFPNINKADDKQVIKIKGEGKITSREVGSVVVEFAEAEVVSGNQADRSLKEMTRKQEVEPIEDDEDEF